MQLLALVRLAATVVVLAIHTDTVRVTDYYAAFGASPAGACTDPGVPCDLGYAMGIATGQDIRIHIAASASTYPPQQTDGTKSMTLIGAGRSSTLIGAGGSLPNCAISVTTAAVVLQDVGLRGGFGCCGRGVCMTVPDGATPAHYRRASRDRPLRPRTRTPHANGANGGRRIAESHANAPTVPSGGIRATDGKVARAVTTTRRTGMNGKHGIIAVAMSLALVGAASAETIILAEPEVRTVVTKAGYAEPVLIKRDQDLWRVRSITPAGQEVTLFVDANGKLLGAADVARTRIVTTTTTTTTAKIAPSPNPIDATTVNAVLADAGFHNVHDVDLKNGVWKAEADDITGEDFEVHVDARTGLIVHVEDD